MTQENRILKYLEEGNSITPIDALNLFGCFRLGARVHELKKQGYKIISETVHQNGKCFARYYIPKNKQLEIGYAI